MTRILWIDILKAFAIFTVVAGHMMSCGAFESNVGKVVYQEFIMAFHMPLFTVLSGWFFKVKPAFMKNKCIGILLPYIVWCFIWYFVKPVLSMGLTGSEVHLSSIVWQMKYFLDDGLCCYGWWFLRGLFFCCVLAFLSVRLAEKCGRKIAEHPYLWGGLGSCVVLYILTFSGIILNQPVKDSLLKGFVYMYPFFWAGYGLKQMSQRYADRMRDLKFVASIWVIFLIALFFWNGETDTFYDMNTSIFATEGDNDIVGMMVVYKTIFRYIVGVVGSFALILLFSHLFGKESEKKLKTLCQNIGKETLGIYILQSLVYWSLPNYDLFGLGNVGNFVLSLLISGIIVYVSYIVIIYSSRSPWTRRFLWGKWK